MKTIVKIVAFLCVFAVFSCNNDGEEASQVCTYPDPMDGKWNLTEASFGEAGVDHLEKGQYVWFINMAKNEIRVENNTKATGGFVGIKTGVYKFELANGVIKVFKAYEEDRDYEGDCAIRDGKLWITNNPEVDGPAYMFERD